MLDEVHNYDKENSDENINPRDFGLKSIDKDQISKERQLLKELKKRIDEDKNDLRRDKKLAEDYKYSDPSSYK